MRPGRRNLITDVAGLEVGHAVCEDAASGVTVILCPELWAAAADVRGGAPGLRETEALAPENLVRQASAVVLSGGSVLGLAAADAVTAALSARGFGLKLHPAAPPAPIVPGAVLYDLGNGGDKAWGETPPYHRLGREALDACAEDFAIGAAGAGRGAMAGRAAGGLGSASLALEGGLVVGALVAVNSVGSVYMPDGETFWAWPFEIDGEFGGRRPRLDLPSSTAPLGPDTRLAAPGGATTIGVVATNAALTPVECRRMAIMAQDGLARAIRPAHTPFDGDTLFSLAGGAVAIGEERTRNLALAALGSAAADCLARAIARGVWAARPAPPSVS
jgi:L-aminopeptidase/D-esterase-like protein